LADIVPLKTVGEVEEMVEDEEKEEEEDYPVFDTRGNKERFPTNSLRYV
jgi:rubrerythrin